MSANSKRPVDERVKRGDETVRQEQCRRSEHVSKVDNGLARGRYSRFERFSREDEAVEEQFDNMPV